MINLDSVLKNRDITLSTKVHTVKTMIFPAVMYVCESWTIKKTEHWRIDAFELWPWRRLLRVPCTARRSNQPIRKEINPEYSLEGLMLKLQYFGHLMQRANSLEKTLMLGKIEDKRRRSGRGWDGWMASPTHWNWIWANSESGDQRSLACCSSWGGKESSDWTPTNNEWWYACMSELIFRGTQVKHFKHFNSYVLNL